MSIFVVFYHDEVIAVCSTKEKAERVCKRMPKSGVKACRIIEKILDVDDYQHVLIEAGNGKTTIYTIEFDKESDTSNPKVVTIYTTIFMNMGKVEDYIKHINSPNIGDDDIYMVIADNKEVAIEKAKKLYWKRINKIFERPNDK